jgi:excisionase family DNA binding protein
VKLRDASDDIVEYARIEEVTRRFGLSRSGLYRLAADGRVRFVKIGASVLVDCATVRAYLSALPAVKFPIR